MKKSSEKIVAGGFGLALLLLCGVAGASYQSRQKLIGRRQWVEDTYQVLEALDKIYDGLADAEIERRGYAIAGEAIDLETYKVGIQTTDKGPKAVRRLTVVKSDSDLKCIPVVVLTTCADE